MSQSLTNAAAWKASELAVDTPATNGAAFGHSDYGTNRTPEARIQTCGYGDAFGENIALGQESPQAVMNAWIASAGAPREPRVPGVDGDRRRRRGRQLGLRLGAGLRRVQPGPDRHPAGEPRPDTVDDGADRAVPLASRCVAPLAPVVAAAPAPPRRRRDHGPAPVRTRCARRASAGTSRGQMQELSCSLNGKTLRRCGSTGRTVHVHRGRHVFRVTVTGPMGTDTQMVRWRVVRG